MSIRTRSGSCCSARRIASDPVLARPTTVKRSSPPSESPTIAASRSSSSQTRIRSGASKTKVEPCHSSRLRCGSDDRRAQRPRAAPAGEGGEPRHVDLDAAEAAGFAGGFFALYVPSPLTLAPDSVPYALPLADPIRVRRRGAGRRRAVRRRSAACLSPSRDVADDFRDGNGDGDRAPRGRRGDRIRPLESRALVRRGGCARSGLVWSRPNAFGEGVPFRFPSTARHGARADRSRSSRSSGPATGSASSSTSRT